MFFTVPTYYKGQLVYPPVSVDSVVENNKLLQTIVYFVRLSEHYLYALAMANADKQWRCGNFLSALFPVMLFLSFKDYSMWSNEHQVLSRHYT